MMSRSISPTRSSLISSMRENPSHLPLQAALVEAHSARAPPDRCLRQGSAAMGMCCPELRTTMTLDVSWEEKALCLSSERNPSTLAIRSRKN